MRLLVNVDDFQVISTLQVLLANPFDIRYSQSRFRRGSAYVQTQDVLCLARINEIQQTSPRGEAGLHYLPCQSGFPLSCRAALHWGLLHVVPS
jgi:hypothetical protein